MTTMLDRAIELYGAQGAFDVLRTVGEAERLRNTDLIDLDMIKRLLAMDRASVLGQTANMTEDAQRATLAELDRYEAETIASATHLNEGLRRP